MAKRTPFQIGAVTIEGGSRQTVDLPVSVLSDHTPVTMSVHVVHGRRSGPTLFVSSGIHGDEVIGVEIVRRLLRIAKLGNLRGTLLVVPIVNAFGFINHSRYMPDRRDLNRCFPGSQSGSLAARLAHLFTNEIIKRCDFGIDLHSAAIHRENLPQIRISPDDSDTLRLARVFGAPVILTARIREGSMRNTAKTHDVDVLIYEAGEGLRFNETAVRIGVTGIMRIMQHLEMLPARGIPKPKSTPILCSSSKWLRAPAGGLLRSFKGNGDVVASGDIMAVVSDPFGEAESSITAPFDGVIVGRAVLPIVNEGDAAYHLAMVKSSATAEAAVDDLTTHLEDDPLFDEDEII